MAALPAEPHRYPTVEYGAKRWIVAFGIALAPLLETVDSSVVNVAIPSIRGNLGASLEEATFIVTGYLTANVIVIPLTPWLAQRFGRHQYLTASIFGFTLASILCGLATNIETLVLLRILQGLFGGGLISTTQAALRDLFPADQANVGQAIFGVVIATGPILGPLIGGAMVDQLSWPWIFYINLVPGLISGFVALLLLKSPHDPQKLPVDVPGVALLAIGIGALQYLLDEGETKDWFGSEAIVWCAAIAFVCLAAFTIHSIRTKTPIVDVRALRDRSIFSGSLLAAAFGAGLLGFNYILPQFLQGALAFTPTLSGQFFIFRGIPIVVLAPAIGAAMGANRFDPRSMIAFGFLATGLGTGWIGTLTTSNSNFGMLVWPLVLAGIGSAFLILPLLTVVVSAVSDTMVPKATAFVALSIQLGGSISSAIVVTLLDRRERYHSTVLSSNITLPHLADIHGNLSIASLYDLVQQQASVLSYADISYLVAALSFAMIPAVFLVRRPPKGRPLATAME